MLFHPEVFTPFFYIYFEYLLAIVPKHHNFQSHDRSKLSSAWLQCSLTDLSAHHRNAQGCSRPGEYNANSTSVPHLEFQNPKPLKTTSFLKCTVNSFGRKWPELTWGYLLPLFFPLGVTTPTLHQRNTNVFHYCSHPLAVGVYWYTV